MSSSLPPPSEGPSRQQTLWAVSLVALTCLAAGLRFTRLNESFWLDEVYSMAYRQASLRSIVSGAWPPLYRSLMMGWLNLFGTDEAVSRIPSAIAGVLAVPLMYVFGVQTLGRAAGLIAAVLMTLSAHQLQYAQEARYYAVLLLFVLTTSISYVQVRRGGGKRWAIAYAASAVAAVETHYFAVFTILAQIVHTLISRRDRASTVRTLLGAGLALVVFAARILVFRAREEGHGQDPMIWIWPPGAKDLWYLSPQLLGWPYRPLCANFALALLALALVALVWRRRRTATRPWPEYELLLWLSFLIPVLLPFTVSLLYKPMFLTRYMMGVTPPLYLLIAGAALSPRRWPLVALLLAPVVWFSAQGAVNFHTRPQKVQWREAAAQLDRAAQPGDVVWLVSSTQITALKWYYKGPATVCPLPQDKQPRSSVCEVDAARQWLLTMADDKKKQAWQRQIDAFKAKKMSPADEIALANLRLTLYQRELCTAAGCE